MKQYLLLLFFVPFIITSCGKDSERGDVVDIEGFLVTDALGNAIMFYGYSSNDYDWQLRNWSDFSSTEQNFLSFTDNIDLSNTVAGTLQSPVAYPSPFINVSNIHFQSADSVKLKIAIVDNQGTVFRTLAVKMKGSQTYAFDFSDSTQFPSGKRLRYYFSFSAMSQANFAAGFGDVIVCRNALEPLTCF